MLKTVVLQNIFVETMINFYIFRILWLIESSKEQFLFEIEIFCNIINGFTFLLIECILAH